MSFTVHLAKENFKFSGSHFTIFGKGEGERLHGHNYYVSVKVEFDQLDKSTGLVFDFNELKPIVKSICESLDEKVLIPAESPYLEIQETDTQLNIQFSEKLYSFPRVDVALLKVANVSSEELSRYLAHEISAQWMRSKQMRSLAVTVEETRGQSVEYKVNA